MYKAMSHLTAIIDYENADGNDLEEALTFVDDHKAQNMFVKNICVVAGGTLSAATRLSKQRRGQATSKKCTRDVTT